MRRTFRAEPYEVPFRRGRELAADVGRDDEKSRGSAEEREKRVFPVRRGRSDRRGAPPDLRQDIHGRDGRAVKGRRNGGGNDQRGRHADRGHGRPLAHHDHVGISESGQQHRGHVELAGQRRPAVHDAQLRERPNESAARTTARR